MGCIVVLDLAVITTGALVVVSGTMLGCTNAGVSASVYFFVVDALMLGDGVDKDGNKSIIIGLEDDSGDGKSLIALRTLFELTVFIDFGDRVSPGLANAKI